MALQCSSLSTVLLHCCCLSALCSERFVHVTDGRKVCLGGEMLLWEAPWICHFWLVTLGKAFITHHHKQMLLQEAAQKSGCDGSVIVFQAKPVLFWRGSLEMFCLSADHKQGFSLFWMLVMRVCLCFALPSPGWCRGVGTEGHGSAVQTVPSWASTGSALWCWREGSYGGGRRSLVLEIQELWDTLSKGS